jgi:spermidine synthase
MYYLERAATLDPRNAEARNNFGNALRAQGRLNEAILQYQQAVELLPNFVMYRSNLASALTGAGRLKEAITHYEEAIKASPSDPFIANNLAWLLATSPDSSSSSRKRAVELAELAVKLSIDNPVNAGTLANAYAAAGRFDDAVAQAEKARDLAVQQGNRDLADLLTEMLASYRMGRIFR